MNDEAIPFSPPPPSDIRFYQLFDSALEGNAEARADLWREYAYDFDKRDY